MQKGPIFAVIAALLLFLVLYFGFSNVAPTRKAIDQTRQVTGTVTDDASIISQGMSQLSPAQLEELHQLAPNQDDSLSVETLKLVSGWWVKAGKPEVSGVYAEKVATLENTAASWSVAGATFHMGITNEKATEIARKYCADAAKRAFENAISLEPENPEHRINLALVYADAPSENPMQAVQILRELETKYPDNPAVYNALGRLAIKTGQWDRALQRLEKALSLDPKNTNTICLLALAYEGKGDIEKSDLFAKQCKSIR